MRSSRDRIARGAIINSILITLTMSLRQTTADGLWIYLITGTFLTLVLIGMWYRFKKLSDRFEASCENYLRKINNEPAELEETVNVKKETPVVETKTGSSLMAVQPC